MSKKPNKSLQIAIIGARVRGTSLARKLSLSKLYAEVFAVVEPNEEKRISFAKEFNLTENSIFTGWEELSEKMVECDAAVIATPDNQHTGPAIACLSHGWHILIEKPLADNLKDCLLIVKTQEVRNGLVAVCHTLRFMDGFREVKQIINNVTIG